MNHTLQFRELYNEGDRTDIQQLQDDLSFVRRAINRRGRRDPAFSRIHLVWADYVLIGITLGAVIALGLSMPYVYARLTHGQTR